MNLRELIDYLSAAAFEGDILKDVNVTVYSQKVEHELDSACTYLTKVRDIIGIRKIKVFTPYSEQNNDDGDGHTCVRDEIQIVIE